MLPMLTLSVYRMQSMFRIPMLPMLPVVPLLPMLLMLLMLPILSMFPMRQKKKALFGIRVCVCV